MIAAAPIPYLGISVTAEALETEIGGQCCVTLNCPEGLPFLLRCIGQLSAPPRIVCEEAGGAERELVRTLHEAGFAVGVVVSEKVCAFAGLHDASEITPHALVRYAAAHPESVRFIEGSATPHHLKSGEASWFKPVVARRDTAWQRIAGWFGRSRPSKARRAA